MFNDPPPPPPASSSHSVRRGETLNFCNGLKWSKYHSPPCICYSFSPVITCCLISWCADKGRRRFHGEGTLAVFMLLSTWHSVHFTAIILSHSTHSATETQGKDLSANCFRMEIKKIITLLLCRNDSCSAAFAVGNWCGIPLNVPFTMPATPFLDKNLPWNAFSNEVPTLHAL